MQKHNKLVGIILIISIIVLANYTQVYSEGEDWKIVLNESTCKVEGDKFGSDYRVLVTNGENRQLYLLGRKEEIIPLRLGTGEYSIKILKHKEGKTYYVKQKNVLKLEDEENKFIESSQPVYWDDQEMVKELAYKLTKDAKTDKEKVENIYNYMIKNITYDDNKELNGRYVPKLDKVLEAKKGICFDYATLFAGMLRSQGIPTKVVEGYVQGIKEYHAWNEVFIDGIWVVMDTTSDSAYYKYGIKVQKYKVGTTYKKTLEN